MRNETAGRPWQVRQTILEIDLRLLKQNYETLAKSAVNAELLVLLKSDAYGHSHEAVAKALDSSKTKKLHGFGVANVEEGIELRRAKINSKVYVLSGIQSFDEDMHRCLETCRLTPVISSLSLLRNLSQVLRKIQKPQLVHLKFNTGMNRLGIDPHELEDVFSLLKKNPLIEVEGLMTHYAASEKKKSAFTKKQTACFRFITARFFEEGFAVKYTHAANSFGLMNHCFPEGNLARVGLHLYGVGNPKLQLVARWTAQVYQIRDIKKGEHVGYGPIFRAKKNMRMAILGVGYGDGYPRSLSNRASVLIQGKRCPVIGAVSMDLTAVDVSKVPGVSTSSRAVLMGADGKDFISAEELAKHAQSISWEILTGISPRVPRVFVHGNT